MARVRALAVLVAGLAGSIVASCFPTLTELTGTGGASSSTSTTSASSGSGANASTSAGLSSSAGTGGSDGGATGGATTASGSSASGSSASTSGSSASSSSGTGGSDTGCLDAGVDLSSDPHNCGRCGHDCCGGQCVGGACQAWIISSGTDPGPPVVDSTYIYWPDNVKTTDGGILRASKTGGSATPLTPGQDHPSAVAVDGTSVYWATNSITGPSYGGVYKTALGGGVPMTLASGTQGTTWVVVNSTNIYWDDHGTNQIQRADLDGSNAAVIAMAGVAGPLQMAIDAQFVYWASRASPCAIQKAPLFGSGATTLSNGTDPVGVAVNSTAIFWANYNDGTIQKAPLPNGGTAVTVATSAGFGANNIAVDESYVYWADLGSPGGKTIDGGPSGTVRAAPVTGNGKPGIVLAESLNPSYVTIDAACVYWTDATSGNVGVVAKP